MIVSNVSSPKMIIPQEYSLPEGVRVIDKTEKIAQVTLYEDKGNPIDLTFGQKPVYRVTIHDLSIFKPLHLYPFPIEQLFIKSHLIKLKTKEKLIEITAEKEGKKERFYVDPSKKVNQSYIVYPYIPQELTAEKAQTKCQHIQTDYPDLIVDFAIYNCFGVALYLLNQKTQEWCLLSAQPQEKKVKLISSSITVMSEGALIVYSPISQIQYMKSKPNYYFLNGEKAQILLLKQNKKE